MKVTAHLKKVQEIEHNELYYLNSQNLRSKYRTRKLIKVIIIIRRAYQEMPFLAEYSSTSENLTICLARDKQSRRLS